ncbi:hypothetical protein G6F62_014339 [Rhizopus arrhizus]|nr:hypothetical protein G6F62_014339 [Rhizopus arrhizus]
MVTREGTRPLLVEVQALVDASPLSNPRRVAVGLEQNRLAMLLAGDGRLQVNARTLLVIPFAMSPALVGISWRFMLYPEFGVVDALLKTLVPGWSGAPVLADPVLAMAALIVVDVWHWAPYFMLPFIGALAALPQDTLDAAQVEWAGRGRIFFEIVLPQLKPLLPMAIQS